MTSQSLRRSESGFTLVELLVVIILTAMFSSLVLGFMISYWRGTVTFENDSETLVTRQDAGDKLRDALNAAAHLAIQNSIPDTHANVPDPADSTGTHWLPIHAIPGNTPMPASGTDTPLIYYTAPSINTSNSFIMNGAQPYYDEFVLYMDGSTKELLLRSLANPDAANNRLKTSCPPAQATATCPADQLIASDLTSIDTRYFSRSGNPIDYTSVVDPTTGDYIGPDFPAVDVAELTLHLARTNLVNNGAKTVDETIIRVALRNS